MNMAALSIFQACVWVEVGIGMFLLDLFAKSILSIKSTCSGCMLESGWLLDCVPEAVGFCEGLKWACRKTVTE